MRVIAICVALGIVMVIVRIITGSELAGLAVFTTLIGFEIGWTHHHRFGRSLATAAVSGAAGMTVAVILRAIWP